MSIQDPIKRFTPRNAKLENDNANVAASACKLMTGIDEDRLDLIASSFSPFPLNPNDEVDMDVESASIDDAVSDSQPSSIAIDGSSVPGETCNTRSLLAPDTHTSSNRRNKRKKTETSNPPLVSTGSVVGEGDGIVSGKHANISVNNNVSDLSSLNDNNKYDRTSQGPYDVIVQSGEGSSSSIDPIAVGRFLYSISKKDIVEIRKVGYSRINVQFRSRDAANGLITNSVLKDKKYKVFIPLYRTSRKGIIRNVPLNMSDEEISREIDSNIVITSVRRLNRRRRHNDPADLPCVNQDTNLVSSKTILITFKGQTLPSYLYLYMVKHSVMPFVSRTSLCFSCFRFGHLSSQCKGHARCQYCGEKSHDNAEACPRRDGPAFCINSKGSHRASSPNCPEYIAQRKIRELAAVENISLVEASKRVRGFVTNTSDPVFNFKDFPSLVTQGSHSSSLPSKFGLASSLPPS
ncbi:unnamed protein product [Lasius platythorax]|uniref:CCHC-type domain-containing protein n=1 Tax=Lasius platythorax TaxID=488582 RepID=A0AAV2P4H7_9HYME